MFIAPLTSERLKKVANGDLNAWESLVRELSGMLYQSAYAVLGHPEEAEDVLQETWIQVRFHAGRFRPLGMDDDAGACRWLRRLVVNCAINWRRQGARRLERELQHGPLPSASVNPVSASEQQEVRESLRLLLAELPPGDQEVILLHYMDGQDHQALASSLACSPAAARKRLQRAIERVRQVATVRHLTPALSLLVLWSNLGAEEIPKDLVSRLIVGAKHANPVLSSHTLFGGMSLMTKLSLITAASVFVAVGATSLIMAQEPKKPASGGSKPAVVEPRPVSEVPPPVIVERPSGQDSSGRHGEYSKKLAQAAHCTTTFATYFGSESPEEFVTAVGMEDDSIVACGNAWGPQFPATPVAKVLGQGKHSGKDALSKDKNGHPTVDERSPDRSGMMVTYSPDCKKILQVIRFDWGVASITTAKVNGKGLVIAGVCGPNFASFAAGVGTKQTIPFEEKVEVKAAKPSRGPKTPKGPMPDVYVAGMNADGTAQWLIVFEKNGDPPDEIFTDSKGRLWFDAKGLRRLESNGTKLTLFNPRTSAGGNVRWLGIHPDGEAAYYGGDRNTNTGAEPYRQPYLYKLDGSDKKLYTLWEPNPKEIGSVPGAAHLESDSSPRAMTFFKDGRMLVAGWSDGGNTVFSHQALDYKLPVSSMGMGMSVWGMKNANSVTNLMLIDDTSQKTVAYTNWMAYIPDWFAEPKNRNAPNFTNVEAIHLTSGGIPVFCGAAATGLIQSPGCYWLDPKDGEKYGGQYVAVFSSNLNNAYFSSYLPGYQETAISSRKKDVLIVGRSMGSDFRAKRPITPTPTVNALQAKFGGGLDAHLIVLVPPKN